MPANFTRTDRNEVEITFESIRQLAVFLQTLIPLVIEMYLRERIQHGISNASHGHSHWIEHVFLPRALDIYRNTSFKDDHFFSPIMHAQLEERLGKNFITQSLTDTYNIGLIERNFHCWFSKDKKSIIISFSETHKGLDKRLQEVLVKVLTEKM